MEAKYKYFISAEMQIAFLAACLRQAYLHAAGFNICEIMFLYFQTNLDKDGKKNINSAFLSHADYAIILLVR